MDEPPVRSTARFVPRSAVNAREKVVVGFRRMVNFRWNGRIGVEIGYLAQGRAVIVTTGPVCEHHVVEINCAEKYNVPGSNPKGVGFSRGSIPKSSVEAAESTYIALHKFFRVRPEYNTRVFLAGQSYAGHYIPPLAVKLKQRNSRVRLEGIILGNAEVAPEIQWRYFPAMLYENGFASREVYDELEVNATSCVRLVHACNVLRKAFHAKATEDPQLLKNLKTTCIRAKRVRWRDFFQPVIRAGRNTYHLGKGYIAPTEDPIFKQVTAFLNSHRVRRFFGHDSLWQPVYGEFEHEIACNFHQLLPDLLHEGLRILVFAGDRDLACNWMGSLAWMKELRWRGMIGFRKATPIVYELPNGDTIGNLRTYTSPDTGGQLVFIRVYGVGHSVAMEAPRKALKMVVDFLHQDL
ncbi:hypothetical protein FOZ63_028056 [Perkinsus olseni]|uniref:Uncharacterized protein n=1 Tax=Perkinsus olseni TaxID=32597 RepID=A0A7J6Q8Q1_PEROL|nr:hypothetical protein FOZ63_028056 [Perkinsus olseni]